MHDLLLDEGVQEEALLVFVSAEELVVVVEWEVGLDDFVFHESEDVDFLEEHGVHDFDALHLQEERTVPLFVDLVLAPDVGEFVAADEGRVRGHRRQVQPIPHILQHLLPRLPAFHPLPPLLPLQISAHLVGVPQRLPEDQLVQKQLVLFDLPELLIRLDLLQLLDVLDYVLQVQQVGLSLAKFQLHVPQQPRLILLRLDLDLRVLANHLDHPIELLHLLPHEPLQLRRSQRLRVLEEHSPSVLDRLRMRVKSDHLFQVLVIQRLLLRWRYGAARAFPLREVL